jgi:hypothetical protein
LELIPLLLAFAYLFDKERCFYFKNCVYKFLQKPISTDELVDKIEAGLKAFEEASKTD